MSFQLRTELCHNTGTQGIQRVSLSHDIIFFNAPERRNNRGKINLESISTA